MWDVYAIYKAVTVISEDVVKDCLRAAVSKADGG